MAGKIRIVTDSSAQFTEPDAVERYGITVIPLHVRLDSRTYREGVDLRPEAFFQRVRTARALPALLPPPIEEFVDVYSRICRQQDQALSLHLSRAMHPTWQTAKTASQSLLGRCEIAVVDSQSTSVGLGWMVETAARIAQETDSLEEVVRAVRKLIPRIYSIFSVESLEYIERAGLMSQSQTILGDMLGVKPFLAIEEGELIAMEKARTRVQAVDKLVEFVTEFAAVEQLAILQPSVYANDQSRMLLERLSLEYSDRLFPTVMYQSSLACFLGPDALGIMVFENDLDIDEPDLYDEGLP